MKRAEKRKRRRKTKSDNYWSNGFSIDETRFSMLALLSIIGFVYALVSDYREGIDDNLLSLIDSVLLAFVGVNAVSGVSNVLSSMNSDKGNRKTYNEDDEEGGQG